MSHDDFGGFQPCDKVEVRQPGGGVREMEFIRPRRGGDYAVVVDRDDDIRTTVPPEDVARNLTAEDEGRADNDASVYGGPRR